MQQIQTSHNCKQVTLVKNFTGQTYFYSLKNIYYKLRPTTLSRTYHQT